MSARASASGTAAGALGRAPSIAGSVAPPYSAQASSSLAGARDPAGPDVELASLDASGRASPSAAAAADEDAPPPAYSPGAALVPTVQLQIQTAGKPWLSLPTPPRPTPIPVYAVSPDTGLVDFGSVVYTSVRHKRGSGSCVLVAGADAAGRPLSATTYRFGPGRPARVTLFDPFPPADDADEGVFGSSSVPVRGGGHDGTHHRDDEEEQDEAGHGWDAFALTPKGLLTRAVGFTTRLGRFEWRYASRAERKAAGASSLLVLDRVTRVFVAGGKEDESRVPVAHLVRNDELRSPGSGPSTAGNGGRLLLDLRACDDGAKTDRRMLEVLAVTTAVSMLKKEVDRRRAHQIAIMAGAGGGGP